MDPFDTWLRAYASSEDEISQANAALALRDPAVSSNPVAFVQAVYSDRLSLLAGRHAYSESGSLHTSVLLHRATVKELFPVPNPKAVEELMGVTLGVLKWLADNRLVLLLIQHPEQYRHLTFLHPLLMSVNPPACYEIRDRTIYQHLADGEYAQLVADGARHPVLGRNEPFPNSLRETYEQLLDNPTARWRQRNAQRYAALAAVMGMEPLDEVLAVPREGRLTAEEKRGVQARFFFLHRYLLHPLTQGLGGLPYTLTAGSQPTFDAGVAQFGAEVERQLLSALAVELPASSTIDLIERVQSTSIPERFESIEATILSGGEAGMTSLSDINLAISVSNTVRELSEESRALERNVTERVQATVRMAGLGAAIGLARNFPELSGLVGGATGLAPRSASVAVVDAFHRVFRRKYLPWQFWRLQRSLHSAKD